MASIARLVPSVYGQRHGHKNPFPPPHPPPGYSPKKSAHLQNRKEYYALVHESIQNVCIGDNDGCELGSENKYSARELLEYKDRILHELYHMGLASDARKVMDRGEKFIDTMKAMNKRVADCKLKDHFYNTAIVHLRKLHFYLVGTYEILSRADAQGHRHARDLSLEALVKLGQYAIAITVQLDAMNSFQRNHPDIVHDGMPGFVVLGALGNSACVDLYDFGIYADRCAALLPVPSACNKPCTCSM